MSTSIRKRGTYIKMGEIVAGLESKIKSVKVFVSIIMFTFIILLSNSESAMAADDYRGTLSTPPVNGGDYEISTVSELYWFADQVNNHSKTFEGQTIRLKNDIVLSTEWVPVGYENLYNYNDNKNHFAGTFDGNNHVIRGLTITKKQNTYSGHYGMFGCVMGGTIKNLGLENVSINLSNVENNGIGNVGGIVGAVGTMDGFAFTMKNCYVTGEVISSGAVAGGLIGYVNLTKSSTRVENCYSAAMVSSISTEGHIIAKIDLSHEDEASIVSNCYYADSSNISDAFSGSTYIAKSKLYTGEMAYIMNQTKVNGEELWGQDLSSKANVPTFNNGKNSVYKSSGKRCDGSTAGASGYSNSGSGGTTSHVGFDKEGFCTNEKCKAPQPADIMNQATCTANNIKWDCVGYYGIKNLGNLYWFRDKVNSGSARINAVLVNNIIVNEGQMSATNTGTSFVPIGYSKTDNGVETKIVYNGTFEGNGRIISGLYYSNGSSKYNCFGLFGYIGSDAKISNLAVKNSYFYLKNANNSNVRAGGICGYCDGGTIENSYSMVTMAGNIMNKVVGEATSSWKITNNFYLNDTDNGTGGKNESQFKSGEVAYLLSDKNGWGQTIGVPGANTSPVKLSDNGANKVNKLSCLHTSEVKYVNEVPKYGEIVTKQATTTENGEIKTACANCGKPDSNGKTISVPKISIVKLQVSTYEYKGANYSPKVYVEDASGQELVNGVDYKYEYPNDRQTIGVHKIKVTFIGKYKGEKTLSFTINPKKPKISKIENTSSGVKLTWNKVAEGTGYYVYRKSTGSFTKIATVSSNATLTYLDKAPKSGTTYTYVVKSFKGSYLSDKSEEKSIRRFAQPKFSVIENTAAGINLRWSKVTGAGGYFIYRKTTGGYTKIVDIKGNTQTSYLDQNVSNGKSYTYAIKAYYGNSVSSINSTGQKMIRLTKSMISSVEKKTKSSMVVQWTKNASASGYEIKYVVGTTTKIVNVSGASVLKKEIGSLIKGKTYTFYIRSYKTVSGKKYYSAWSTKRSKVFN